MTIYLDIIFIENLLMNYIILFTTGYAAHLKMNNLRIFFSSMIGAIYSAGCYIKSFYFLHNVGIKLLISLLMIWTAYKFINYKHFLKMLVLFYLTSFAIGGISFAIIFNCKDRNRIIGKPTKLSFVSGIVGFIVIQISFTYNKKLLKNRELICNIEIGIGKKKIKTKAFIDSGNTLKDPYSGKSVVIVEKVILKEALKEIDNANKNIEEKKKKENIDLKSFCDMKPRLIPYHSVGSQNKMLVGINVDYIIIENFEGRNYKIENIVIGLYEGKISKNYSALLGLELVK
jgi:stage II sporulation protein GA (sporulation sigma-E factor processing peptidase)